MPMGNRSLYFVFDNQEWKNGKYFLIIGFIFISVFLITLHMWVRGCRGMGYVCVILIDWSALKDSGAEEIPRGVERYNAMSYLWSPSLSYVEDGNDSSSVETISPLLFLTNWTHCSSLLFLFLHLNFPTSFPMCLPWYFQEKSKS